MGIVCDGTTAQTKLDVQDSDASDPQLSAGRNVRLADALEVEAVLCAVNNLHLPAFVSKARIILEVSQAVQHSAMCRWHAVTKQPPLSLAGAPHIGQQIKVVWTAAAAAKAAAAAAVAGEDQRRP
jgi:hypothetical protein